MKKDERYDLSTRKEIEARFYKCKKCGHEYYESWNHCPNCRTPSGKNSVRPFFWTLLIIAIAILFIANPLKELKQNAITSSNSDVGNENELSPEPEENVLYPLDPPNTGIYQVYTDNELVAPFETRNHNDNYAYLLKFVDSESKETTLTVFLNKNENSSIKVPLGNYEILYAFQR